MKDLITDVIDFPKKGINYKDISPLLASPRFNEAVALMGGLVDMTLIDAVVGIESRGFILGAGLAQHFSKGFIPVRKKGKLPPPVVQASYQLEYGNDVIEMKKGAGRVLLVDDVLATGGTLKAALELCLKAGYQVADVCVLIDLRHLNQFRFGGQPVKSLLQYES
jgi:adenine phosphoribosyltransferase